MIGYVCKYTPVEALESMGAEMVRVEPSVVNFDRADALMHPNACSYAKAVLEEFAKGRYDGLVLTTCCDSIRRLYDVLRDAYPEKFFWMLDVPRVVNGFSAGIFAKRIRALAEAYGRYAGAEPDENALRELLLRRAAAAGLRGAPENPDGPRVGIVGARYGNGFRNVLEDAGARIVFDMTCAGMERRLPPPAGDIPVPEGYARALLNQLPCLRMADAAGRRDYLAGFADELDGVVCHTVKFCDIYSYEYASLRRRAKLPILKLETDTTPQCEGQLRTRAEAFLESLRAAKGKKPAAARAAGKKDENLFVLGIDSGSTSTNAAVLNGKAELVASCTVRTGAKVGDSADRVLREVLKKAGLAREGLAAIVATGYGREAIPFAGRAVTEITCHARGARYFNPKVRTILDIGGQDSKAIRLNGRGEVADFAMNDKCAAGTGRFLEAMARTLELGIAELGPVSLRSKKDVTISSMCTVFAESEVISLIAQNCEKADIARGVHRAIAGKACSLLARVHPEPEYMMTGGVARNPGVVRAVEEKLGAELFLCPDPEIVGAVGAALLALDDWKGK